MRFVKRIRDVQAVIRVFIERRRGHIEILSHEWQKIEDKYLEQQFKENKQKMIEEARAKAEEEKKKKGGAKKSDGPDYASMPMKGDVWKNSRATVEVRERALYREYNARLHHYVKMQDRWRSLNGDALNAQKDLNSFLRSLGAEPQQEDLADVAPLHAPPPTSEKREFWRPSDEQLLEVIIKTAEEVERARTEKKEQKRKGGQGMGPKSRKSMEAMERDIAGIKIEEEVKKKEDFMIDHLFRDLSPRLQKISDDCMKDDANTTDPATAAAAAPSGSKGNRPAPALESATSSVIAIK
jgi:hypothetical protein